MVYTEFKKTLKDGNATRIVADEHAAKLLRASGRAAEVQDESKKRNPAKTQEPASEPASLPAQEPESETAEKPGAKKR